MFDTLAIKLPYTGELSTLLAPLSFTSDGSSLGGAAWWASGQLNYPNKKEKKQGFRVRINENRIIIDEGSLCKYFYGNNVQTLDIIQAEVALMRLSKALQIDWDVFLLGEVGRIDFSENFQMESSPATYFPELSYLPNWGRNDSHKTSLYFNQTEKQLIFYDKVKESPEYFKNKQQVPNLLRYEMRLFQPQKHFKRTIRVKDLIDPNFYNQLLLEWEKFYLKIYKTKSPVSMTTQDTITSGQMQTLMLQVHLQKVGLDKQIKMINQMEASGKMTSTEAKRARTKFKNLWKAIPTDKHLLIKELDSKISNHARTHKVLIESKNLISA